MSIATSERLLPIAEIARLTTLSDETIRNYCIAAPKGHFPGARRAEGRWEVPEHEVRAAKIIDRWTILTRTELTESRLTQLERLGKLTCSSEGKFSLDQEVYLHSVRALENLASASAFEERAARNSANESRNATEPEGATVPSPPAAATPALQEAAQGVQVSQPQQQTEIVLVRPGIALMKEFVAYMTEHKDPARLPDEFFAGDYAPEFIPPVGVEYHVALGPGGALDEDRRPTHTWVRTYPRWTYDGKNLRREGEFEAHFEGIYPRGSIPDEYAEGCAEYRFIRGLWNLRATEARGRLKERARAARVTFLPDFVWQPDVRNWVQRYKEERLHPSVFPDSVKAALVNVPFVPTHNMFFYESTGEVRNEGEAGEYTIVAMTLGFSDDFGPVDDSAPDQAWAVLMWAGSHAEGEVRPADAADNAEYLAWEAAWEDMQREGRRLKERQFEWV